MSEPMIEKAEKPSKINPRRQLRPAAVAASAGESADSAAPAKAPRTGNGRPKAAPKGPGKSPTKGPTKAPGKAPAKAAGSPDGRDLRAAAALIKQISDPTRMMLVILASEAGESGIHVTDLCSALGQSQPAVSHHLALLRHSGILMPRRAGKNNYYSATAKGATLAAISGTVMASASK